MSVRLALVSTVVGLLVLGAACGGGGGALSLEEYLQELERLDQQMDERSQGAEDAFDEAINEPNISEEEGLEAVQTFFNDSLPILQDFVEGVEGLEPPEEAQKLHDEAVAAGRGALERLERLNDDLGEATTRAEVQELFSAVESDEAFQRFEDACNDMQALADENEIDVDFDCGDER